MRGGSRIDKNTKTSQGNAKSSKELFLKVQGLKKSFGHIEALRDISMDVYTNEVTAIVGDNGAGKTTLIKTIAGVIAPDEGEIVINGNTYNRLSPAQAIKLGISTVYQDLSLVDCRDVSSNIFLGREPLIAGFFVNKRLMNKRSEEILRSLKIDIPSVSNQVSYLSGGQRQSVAVARSVNQEGSMIIFDEPTAAMGVKESGQVLNIIRHLGDNGYAVLIISHNLHHVFKISDRICVIRNGKLVGEFVTEHTNPDEVVQYITGSYLNNSSPSTLNNFRALNTNSQFSNITAGV